MYSKEERKFMNDLVDKIRNQRKMGMEFGAYGKDFINESNFIDDEMIMDNRSLIDEEMAMDDFFENERYESEDFTNWSTYGSSIDGDLDYYIGKEL